MKKTKDVSKQLKEWFVRLKIWMSRNTIEIRTVPLEDLHRLIHKLQKQAIEMEKPGKVPCRRQPEFEESEMV